MNKKRVGIYIELEQLKEIKKNAIDKGLSMSEFLVTAGTVGFQPNKETNSTAGAAVYQKHE
ncbi:MAG: hypothetical protein ABID64_01095 [Nitrospirota bacterium]